MLRLLGEGLGAEIGTAVAIELDDTLYIPLYDRQGNVTTLLDAQGQVADSYRYDAFGNEVTPSHNTKNPWRFSSKRVDKETGFIYFGRRYYDPTLGKWLTQDPLGLKAGPNLYAYVVNNPLTHFDLYGLLNEKEATSVRLLRIGVEIGCSFFGTALFAWDMASYAVEVARNPYAEWQCIQTTLDDIRKIDKQQIIEIIEDMKASANDFYDSADFLDYVEITAKHCNLRKMRTEGQKLIEKAKNIQKKPKKKKNPTNKVAEDLQSVQNPQPFSRPAGISDQMHCGSKRDASLFSKGGPPRDPKTANYLPDPNAFGSAHTTLGVRDGTAGTYAQGATFDKNEIFRGRTDVTDHGRRDHANPHYHPAISPNSVKSGSHPLPDFSSDPSF